MEILWKIHGFEMITAWNMKLETTVEVRKWMRWHPHINTRHIKEEQWAAMQNSNKQIKG